MLNELTLLIRIKEGDIGSFEKLFKKYYSPLCLFSCSITGRMEIAEEVVQELFYTLWKEREQLSVLRSVKSYLYGAVKNQSVRYCEQQALHEGHHQNIFSKTDSYCETPQSRMEMKEMEQVISRTLAKMPERRQLIFRMHRFQQLKYKEIAQQLSLSVKTVEAEMTKSYATLRKEMDKYR